VPELELEVGPHALCGRFTTIEGLLMAMKDQLLSHWGDSATEGASQKYEDFLKKMQQALEGTMPVTVILDDPAGNSYVQVNSHIFLLLLLLLKILIFQFLEDGEDPNVKVNRYERSFDQNEELGLNHMKTEDYHDASEL